MRSFQVGCSVPGSVCFIVMHCSTGHTSEQMLQPTQFSSIMAGTRVPACSQMA